MSWPEIEGIETSEASSRWCGEVDAFAAGLDGLFERFADVLSPCGEIRLENLKEDAKRMHKLRGAATALGARGIYFVAGQLEAAYLAQDLRMATHLRSRLAEDLKRLREHARAALGSPRLANTQLRRLDELLLRQDLAALELLESMSADLEQILGCDAYQRLVEHVQGLKFREASLDLQPALVPGRSAA